MVLQESISSWFIFYLSMIRVFDKVTHFSYTSMFSLLSLVNFLLLFFSYIDIFSFLVFIICYFLFLFLLLFTFYVFYCAVPPIFYAKRLLGKDERGGKSN